MPKHRERTYSSSRKRLGVAALVIAGVISVIASSMSLSDDEAAAGQNLVINPDFETNTSGWFVRSGGSLTRAQGHGGVWSGRVTNLNSHAQTVALNDQANTVTSTVKGATVTASTWVRTTAPGTTLAIRLMEYSGSRLLGQQRRSLWLRDDRWHQVSVTYVAASDAATIDLNVLAWGLPPGAAFDVDDVVLTTSSMGAAVVAPPPPTISTTTSPTPTATTSIQAPPPPSPSSPPVQTPPPPTVVTPPVQASPPPAAPTGWRLVWSDEFAGQALDGSKWNAEHISTYGEGNKELPCLMNRPENLQQANGVLVLRALREATPIVCGRDPRFPNGRSYTSAHITTKGKAEFEYGRFEIRARLPLQADTSKGLWPAFWMRPASGGIGELDILEAVGSGAGGSDWNKIVNTLHYDYNGTYPRQGFQSTVSTPSDWHTYAAEWEPGVIRFLIDGNLVWTRTQATTPWLDDAFGQPFYMRINLAVGGNWPGSPDGATRFPAEYQLDYVRVYQR